MDMNTHSQFMRVTFAVDSLFGEFIDDIEFVDLVDAALANAGAGEA